MQSRLHSMILHHHGPGFFRIPSLDPHRQFVIDFSIAAHTGRRRLGIEYLLDEIFSFITIKSSVMFTYAVVPLVVSMAGSALAPYPAKVAYEPFVLTCRFWRQGVNAVASRTGMATTNVTGLDTADAQTNQVIVHLVIPKLSRLYYVGQLPNRNIVSSPFRP
jgi:hypothetical protein